MNDEDPRGWDERLLFGMSWIVWVPLLILVILLGSRAFAHDHNHPELNDWYKSLHAKGGAWCCDGHDAETVEEWSAEGDHYRAKINGKWIDIPADAVVEGPNRAGEAKIWLKYWDGEPAARCFIPGTMT